MHADDLKTEEIDSVKESQTVCYFSARGIETRGSSILYFQIKARVINPKKKGFFYQRNFIKKKKKRMSSFRIDHTLFVHALSPYFTLSDFFLLTQTTYFERFFELFACCLDISETTRTKKKIFYFPYPPVFHRILVSSGSNRWSFISTAICTDKNEKSMPME